MSLPTLSRIWYFAYNEGACDEGLLLLDMLFSFGCSTEEVVQEAVRSRKQAIEKFYYDGRESDDSVRASRRFDLLTSWIMKRADRLIECSCRFCTPILRAARIRKLLARIK